MEAAKLQNTYLNEKQLKVMAVNLAKQIWGVDYNLPIIVSKRMTSTLGYFQHNNVKRNVARIPIKIQISWYLVNGNYTYETVESVMKHELCHWYLFITNQNFSDSDFTFKRECLRIGSHLTHTIKSSGSMYIGVCSCCERIIVKARTSEKARKDCIKYRSKCHKAKLIYRGLEVIEDNNSNHITRQTNVGTSKIDEMIAPIVTINFNKPELKNTADTTFVTNIEITDLVKAGPKGVTNFQMIPAMKLVLDENSKIKLAILKSSYPAVFESSLKYIGKKYTDKLNKLI